MLDGALNINKHEEVGKKGDLDIVHSSWLDERIACPCSSEFTVCGRQFLEYLLFASYVADVNIGEFDQSYPGVDAEQHEFTCPRGYERIGPSLFVS